MSYLKNEKDPQCYESYDSQQKGETWKMDSTNETGHWRLAAKIICKIFSVYLRQLIQHLN